MKCKTCGTDFHYCGSCGWIGHAELGCCSDDCVENHFTLIPDKQRYQELATLLIDDTYSFLHDIIKQNIDGVCEEVDKQLRQLYN